MTLREWLTDTAERVGSTVVQALIVYVLGAQAIDGEFWRGLLTVCVIAVVNVVRTALLGWIPAPQTWFADMMVRVVWTFLIALTGSLVSVEWLDLISIEFWHQVVIAAAMSALAVVKALWAKRFPGTISPASLALKPAA